MPPPYRPGESPIVSQYHGVQAGSRSRFAVGRGRRVRTCTLHQYRAIRMNGVARLRWKTRRRCCGMTFVTVPHPCGGGSMRAGACWHGPCPCQRSCSSEHVPPNRRRRRYRRRLPPVRQKRKRTPHGATETSARSSWTARAREVFRLGDWNGGATSGYAQPSLRHGRHPPSEQHLANRQDDRQAVKTAVRRD